jgi:hypothetical protein
VASLIKPSHRGRLHRALGVPEGEKIPAAKLEAARHSKNVHMREMAQFAQNFGKTAQHRCGRAHCNGNH